MERASPKNKIFSVGHFLGSKNFLYFGKWNFLAPSIKHSYTFSKKNSYISEGNLESPKNKKSYISLKKVLPTFWDDC